MTTIIDGKAAAAALTEQVRNAAAFFEAKIGQGVGLAVVLVGDDPASQAYVGAKGRVARQCGFTSFQHSLPAKTSQRELAELVRQLNDDPQVHGILVQLPLPAPLNPEAIVQSILPTKDVDGLNIVNAGKLATGDLKTGLIPCTPAGAMLLIRGVHGPDLSGLNAVVIGRSNLFGKPMAQLLLNANATVTLAHSRTRDLPAICRGADILVAAVGRARMVQPDWVKSGATIIDVGINRVNDSEKGHGNSRPVGDVDYDGCAHNAGAMTPVPGGVGPMTIAMLMANTVTAAFRSQGMPLSDFE